MIMIGFSGLGLFSLNAQSSIPSASNILSVRLLSPSPIVCFGQSEFPFEAVLTNNSDVIIEVSKNGVEGFYFEEFHDGKVIHSQNGVGEVVPGNWVRIFPHQSAIAPFTWEISPGSMSSGGLFDSPGTFSAEFQFLVITRKAGHGFIPHGSVQTNKVMFMISDCSVVTLPHQSPISKGVPTVSAPSTLLHESGHADPPKPQ
jgi:hypothetical protein